MFPLLRCATLLSVLMFIGAPLAARADDVATSPAPYVPRIDAMFYAPDGRLWSVDDAWQLVIRASDGKTELYRGKLPVCDKRHLEFLYDGSFIVSNGSPQWFEPPQKGQPLKLRRAFEGPQEKAWQQFANWPSKERIPKELMRQIWGGQSFGDLAISPDEKWLAESFKTGFSSRSVLMGGPTTDVIRVWNLESGELQSTQKLKDTNRSQRDLQVQLAWAKDRPLGDYKILVVARGLSVQRFDAATGTLVSEWKPDDAPDVLARALKIQSERDVYLRSARPLLFEGMSDPAPPFPLKPRVKFEQLDEKWAGNFDAATQQLLALSNDGKQLLASDGAGLLTLWETTTGKAQILGEFPGFVPSRATVTFYGTVAAWNGDVARIWRDQSELTPRSERHDRTISTITGLRQGQIALKNKLWETQIAVSQGADRVLVFPYEFPSGVSELRGEPMRWEKPRQPESADTVEAKAPIEPAVLRAQSAIYAPDGKTVWELGSAGNLQIRSVRGDQLIFDEKLPPDSRRFRILDDNSLLVLSSWGDVLWLEPPVKGQPLKIKREFVRPEPERHHLKTMSQQETDKLYRHKYGVQEDGVDWALSPDGKLLAASTVFNPRDFQDEEKQKPYYRFSSLSDFSEPLATVSVWELASGRLVSQQRFSRPRIYDAKPGSNIGGTRIREAFGSDDKNTPPAVVLPTLVARLSWESYDDRSDYQTLTINDGSTFISVQFPSTHSSPYF